MENKSIPSPFSEFDYTAYREEKCTPAIKRILAVVSQNSDILVFKGQAKYNDLVEKFDTVAKEIVKILIEENVAETDRQFIFDYISQIFLLLSDNIKKQAEGNIREILARVIGVKDPGSSKFSADYANIGNIFEAVLKVRKETGDDLNDYFFINKSEDNVPNNENQNEAKN